MGASMVGHVTRDRNEELLVQARELVELQSRCQFALGDKALEIEPIQQHGGQGHSPVENIVPLDESLRMFAEDISVPLNTVRNYRWVAAAPVRRIAQSSLQRVTHTMGLIDLVGACAAFVAAGGPIVPVLRGSSLTDDERGTVNKNLTQVRTTADWIEPLDALTGVKASLAMTLRGR